MHCYQQSLVGLRSPVETLLETSALESIAFAFSAIFAVRSCSHPCSRAFFDTAVCDTPCCSAIWRNVRIPARYWRSTIQTPNQYPLRKRCHFHFTPDDTSLSSDQWRFIGWICGGATMLNSASSLYCRQSLTGSHRVSLETPGHCSNLLIELRSSCRHFDQITN